MAPVVVGAILTVILLMLGALRHRGFLYVYVVLVAITVVVHASDPPYDFPEVVVVVGFVAAGVLVGAYLRATRIPSPW